MTELFNGARGSQLLIDVRFALRRARLAVDIQGHATVAWLADTPQALLDYVVEQSKIMRMSVEFSESNKVWTFGPDLPTMTREQLDELLNTSPTDDVACIPVHDGDAPLLRAWVRQSNEGY